MKHRGLDRLETWVPRASIVGIKAVSFEEYCLKEAFGGPPALPESLLLQAAVDLAGWLVMLSTDYGRLWWPEECEEARFAARLRPGGRARLAATVLAWDEAAMTCRVEGTVDGAPLFAAGPWRGRLLPLADWRDPADMRVLYSEIAATVAG